MMAKIMVTRIEQLADEFGQAGYNNVALELRNAARNARTLGIPERLDGETTHPEATLKEAIDLRQQTYKLLHLVRQPSDAEKEALGRKGIIFLSIDPKSYAQVVAEDGTYFWNGELDYANARPQLRDYALPVAMEVGFNPTRLALPDSFSKSRLVQLQMIEDYSQQLQAELSDARAIMLPSTGYAQADRAYKARTGEVLIRDFFARALDDLSGVYAAVAGRYDPSEQFFVLDWYACKGDGGVRGVPAVVFVGSK